MLGARLGGGAFGEVYVAVWRGAEVAVKFINREFVFSPPGSPKRLSRGELENIYEDEVYISDSNSDDVDDGVVGDNNRGNNMKNNIEDMNNMHKEEKRREKEVQNEQFLREAETLATLSHPNVVSIFGVVTDGDVNCWQRCVVNEPG